MAGGEDSGGVHYDPTSGVARPTADGKRRLIRGEGFASRISGTVRPQDPGGGATPVAAPRLMTTDDISDTTELLRGGGAPVVPSRISVVLVEETSRPECPCDDQERQPLVGGAVSEGDTRSPWGGGALPSSGTAGRLFPVDVMKTPALSVEGPRSVPSRISVVMVDGTMAGDTPGWECRR